MSTFSVHRLTPEEIETFPVRDGQFILEIDSDDNGKILYDKGNERLRLGGNIMPKFKATFLTNGWSASAPYTQTVTVNGVTSNTDSIPILNTDSALNETDRKLLQKNYGYIWYFDTGLNTIKAVSKFTKPTVNLTVEFRGE